MEWIYMTFVAHMTEMKTAYNILIEKPEGKR
jgi:hypothetical protein